MSEKRNFQQQVQGVVETFFDTGAPQDDRVHTLTISHALSPDTEEKLATVLRETVGVKDVHVDTQNLRVHVLGEGEIESLISAAQAAGFNIDRAY